MCIIVTQHFDLLFRVKSKNLRQFVCNFVAQAENKLDEDLDANFVQR